MGCGEDNLVSSDCEKNKLASYACEVFAHVWLFQNKTFEIKQAT